MKHFLLFLIALAISSMSFATPLTGTKTVGAGQDYATLALAIADLNLNGVGANGVTFNVVAGHTETLTAPLSITATGTASDQIVFQKFGSGANPLITAYVGTNTPGTAVQDGMWNLVGSDYVTIDGIDLYDPNTTNPATMEYGYAMFKVDGTNGCQYNTIKNCVVTLSRNNNASGTAPAVDGSRAINVMNSTVAAQTTVITPTTAGGTNSYNKFYTNTLQNCNIGIAIIGYAAATPFTLGDTGNDIGGTSSFTGNTVINFGGAAAALNPAAGIRVNNQWGINISYNTINNNNGSGVNHPLTLRGIYAAAGTSASATINYNTITLACGATSSSVYGIDNGIGSTAASNTVDIKNNIVSGAYTTATSGAWYGIQNTGGPANLNISYNTVQTVTTPGTGGLYGIYSTGVPTNNNISNNTVTGLTKTGIGLIYGIYPGSGILTIASNTVDGLTCSAAASTAAIYAIYTFNAATESFTNNIVRNLSTTGTATVCGLYFNSATGNKTVQNNQFYNFTVAGGGTIYGIRKGYGGTDDVSGNQLYNFSITGATSGTIYGIYNSATTTLNLYNNSVYGFSVAGGTGGTMYGIYLGAGITNAYKNKIYNLATASTGPTLYGAYLSGGTTTNFYNNFISDLRTTAANSGIPLVGIYVGGASSANNVFYNSVYLNATSTGAIFGSAALYASTTYNLDLRDNVLVNVSTPNSTGITAAYRRSSTTLTSYSANSNANCFYAGAPGTNNLIMYDGTNSYQTMAAYQTAVGPSRDAVSFRELPPFVNVITAPFDLHMQTTIATLCESGGISISTPIAVTDDFDGNTRGATPDVGADEFAGLAGGVINPGGVTATAISSQQVNIAFTPNLSSNNVVIVYNATGTFTAPTGAPTVGNALAGGTVLYVGTTSPYSHTGLTYNVPAYYKVFSYDGAAYSSGIGATATPSVAPPTALAATAFSAAQINTTWTNNAAGNNVILATASTSSFGTPKNGKAYIVGDTIGANQGTIIYIGTLAAFNHTGLSANTAYYYKAWSTDAFNYKSSTGATANATTPCASISTFPFTESFSATLGCWSYGEGAAGATSHWGTATSDATHGVTTAQSGTGTYFARLDVYNAQTAYNPYYFYSPAFVLDATAKQVKYYYWLGTGGNQLSPVPLTLQISTNNGATWTDLYAHTSANSVFATATTSPWTLNVVSLAAYVGQTVKFRFTSNSNYGSGFCNQAIDEFGIENVPSCPPPTTLTATSVTSTTASLGWTGTSTNYDVAVGLAGFTPGTPTATGVSAPYAASGLSPNTSYDFYVRGNCPGPLQSTWAGPKNFVTLCASVSSLSENFDAVAVPNLPSCWNKYTSPTYSAQTVTTVTTTPNSSPNCVQLYSSGASVSTDAPMLISPPISNLNAGTYQLRFFAKGNSTNLSVIVGTMSDPANSATFTPLQTVTGLNTTSWTEVTVSFASYAGTNTYIAIQHPLTTTYAYLYIDNVNWEPIPLCPAPTALTATNITTSTAQLGWTAGALNYDIELGANGFTPTGTPTYTAVTNPYTVSGLTSNTAYAYYVRGHCTSGTSTWSGPKSFTTACSSTTIPYTETFDTYTPPATGCGTVQDVNADGKFWATTAGTTNSGANKLSIGYSALGVNMDDWYFTQGLQLTGGVSYDLKFYHRVASSTWFENLEVKYGTTASAAGMTSAAVFTAANYNNATYTLVKQSFTPSTTGVYYIGFHCYSAGDQDGIFLDDINVTATPLCPAPYTLLATPGNTFANLSWTAGGSETSWDIEWGLNGFTQGTGTTVLGVTNPYTLHGLTPTTTYAYYVRANCGSGSLSSWIGPKSFTTLVACPAPTNLAATNLTKTSADLNWTENGTSTTWNIEWGPQGYTHLGAGSTLISGVTSKPYNLSGLTAGTNYSFYVQSDCGGGTTSTWVGPISFTTVCGTISTFPWTEGFESMVTVGSKILPACWSYENVSGTSGPYSSATSSTYSGPRTGTHYIYTYYGNTTWIFTPSMDLVAGTSYDFQFYMMNKDLTPPDYFTMDVAYGTSNTSAGMTNVLASGIICNNATYTEFKYTFTPATSGVYYMGIKSDEPTGYPWYLSFDDFKFEPTPACPEPSGLTVAGVGTTDASLTWTGATTVKFDYGAVGHAAGTGTITASTTSNPYVISGLTPATSYDVYIKNVCSTSSQSPWNGPVTLTTNCVAATAINQNFDAVTTPNLPVCWSKYVSPTYTSQTVVTTTSVPNSSPNCVQLYSSYATASTDAPMLISPQLSNLNSGNHWLRFAAKGASTNTSVIVGTMSDPTNSSTFTPFQTVTGLSITNWTNEIIDFSAYAGSDQYIAFQHPQTTTYSYIYIDDVVWEPKQPLLSVTPTSLALGYVANGGSSAEQSYSLSGLNLTGSGNLTVTAPAGFEVSLTSGSGFGSSVLVPYTGPALVATPIYVKFMPTLANTDYAGNITNAGASALTVNVAVTATSNLLNSYCTSSATNVADEDVFNVTLGTLNNTSDCFTTGGTGSTLNLYSNYKGLAPTNLEQGATVPISLSAGTCGTYNYNNAFGVFIDFDQSGTFDAGEQVYVSPTYTLGAHTETGTITIPVGAIPGHTLMRVICKEGTTPSSIVPCGTYSYGETEDYIVNITLSTTPALGASPTVLNFGQLTPGSTSAEKSYHVSGVLLTPASGNVVVTPPAGYKVSLTSGSGYASTLNIPYTGGAVSANVYVVLEAATANLDYSGTITNVAGSLTASVAVSGNTFPTDPYCTSTLGGLGSCPGDITNVTFHNLVNTNHNQCSTANGSTLGIYYPTGTNTTALVQGTTYPLSVTTSTSDIISVWIDFNQNGIFEPTEWTQITTTSTVGVASTANVAIPSGALAGLTGMRIRTRGTGNPNGSTDACTQFYSGITEDYFVTITPPVKTLNVKVYLEGLYNGTTMNQAMDINPTPKFTAPVADQMTVELHNSTTPYAIAQSYTNVNLNVNGLMNITTIPGSLSGSYYIVVKHRNSMETWSAAPVSLTGSGPFTYDFTTFATQAYGDNLKPIGSVFVIYGGDVNVDGVVDGSDMANVDNASTSVLQGYFAEDVNGDGVVDGSDMAIVDNNATAVIQAQRPPL
ncbi:MAG: fibronectin type III domain-containing protein [Bacteroidetes bacterium]|nr:fibronectin type III domain-containing protein [Bacteroidota bacterium]